MTDSSADPLVDARGLVLAYGSHVALAASDLQLPARAITAIIGPNGSGKSTLLHALAGVHEPAAGELRVLGGSPRQVRARVSYVLQSVSLAVGMPLTVAETVGMGRYPRLGLWRRRTATDRARVAESLRRLDIEDLTGRHLTELSGGQRQRVYVAQGVAQDHDLLVLDEPLTGLDLVSAKVIDALIHAERDAGRAVVLTTHDLDEACAADHVVLVSGRVVASGPPAEVLTRANIELAYRLGSLHPAGAAGFLDDPHGDPAPC